MTTDELITTLRPYGLTLHWSESGDIWQVTLNGWNFLHTEHNDYREALRLAYEQLMEEKEGQDVG